MGHSARSVRRPRSGESNGRLAVAVVARSRLLRERALVDDAVRLRSRARNEWFDAHPSELIRLRRRGDVLASGVSAAEQVGVIGNPEEAEFYAPEGHRAQLVESLRF